MNHKTHAKPFDHRRESRVSVFKLDEIERKPSRHRWIATLRRHNSKRDGSKWVGLSICPNSSLTRLVSTCLIWSRAILTPPPLPESFEADVNDSDNPGSRTQRLVDACHNDRQTAFRSAYHLKCLNSSSGVIDRLSLREFITLSLQAWSQGRHTKSKLPSLNPHRRQRWLSFSTVVPESFTCRFPDARIQKGTGKREHPR